MTCKPSPSCSIALAEATALWPNRRKTSDGICASPQHTAQSPNSDHEPDASGYAHAFDLSTDPANGCDANALAELLRVYKDPRVKYVIANRRMFSSYPTSQYQAWTWRPYSGADPHTSHIHVSILPDATFATESWWGEGDMSAFLNDDDERKVLIRQWYWEYLGRNLSVDDQTHWLEVARSKGMDAVLAGLIDSPEAQAYRARTPDTH